MIAMATLTMMGKPMVAATPLLRTLERSDVDERPLARPVAVATTDPRRNVTKLVCSAASRTIIWPMPRINESGSVPSTNVDCMKSSVM